MAVPPVQNPTPKLEEVRQGIGRLGGSITRAASSVAKANQSVSGTGATPAGAAIVNAPAASGGTRSNTTAQQDPNERGHRLERPISHVRMPVVLTTTAWMSQDKFIGLWVNPLSANWAVNRRETSTKTAAGVVRNTWRNRYRQTYYDEYMVAFTFQTGNIMPSAGTPDRLLNNPQGAASTIAEPNVPPGLIDFYRFMSMVDQPMLLGQAENRHHIYYRSRVFPLIHLEGYFIGETAIAFNENAEGNANQLQWTATFQVYKSTPPLNNATQLISTWKAIAHRELMSEILPNSFVQKPVSHGLTNKNNNSTGSKPTPTSQGGGAQELSTGNAGGKRIGVVSGNVAGKNASTAGAMNPEILTSIPGRLVSTF